MLATFRAVVSRLWTSSFSWRLTEALDGDGECYTSVLFRVRKLEVKVVKSRLCDGGIGVAAVGVVDWMADRVTMLPAGWSVGMKVDSVESCRPSVYHNKVYLSKLSPSWDRMYQYI